MSESLMFAILGFLVACLFGTVFASFLWRRAVVVTTRRISQDENFASLEEVADLKAEVRELQSSLRASSRDVEAKDARIVALEDEKSKAEANIRSENDSLRHELKTAATALETARDDRANIQAELAKEKEAAKALLDAKEAELASSKERVEFLETSIRAIAENASALLPAINTEPEKNDADRSGSPGGDILNSIILEEPSNDQDTPLDATKTDASEPVPVTNNQKPAEQDETKDRVENALPGADLADNAPAKEDGSIDPSAMDITRSLEERIEALKQGQATH